MGTAATQIAFADSFRALAATAPVDRITVGEICAGAGKSPATFYRHFHDKYALAAWDYARLCQAITSRIGQGGYTWPQALRDDLAFHWSHRDYLANLLIHTHGHDSFVRSMTEVNIQLTRDLLGDIADAGLSHEFDLCIKMYCHGIVAVVCDWVMGLDPCDTEQLAQHIEFSLPAPLRPLLLPHSDI